MHRLYSKYASPQKAIIDERIPQILHIIENLPTKRDVPFVLGDFGAADGGNALSLQEKIIGCLKDKHGSEYEILIVLEDQLANDFNSLFKVLDENCNDQPEEKNKNVYFTAVAKTFFMQCLPKNTLDFAFASCSLHWIPTNTSNPYGILSAHSVTTRDLAAKCWYNFLVCRSEELKPGGYAFLTIPCVHEGVGNEPYIKNLEKGWYSLYEEGTITEEERDNMVLPVYYRSEQELRLPFERKNEDGDGVNDKMNLELISLDLKESRYSFYEKRRKQIENGVITIKTVAKEYADCLKGFSYELFLSSLSTSREKDEKHRIMDRLYERICDVSTLEPEKCDFFLVVASIVVKKVQTSMNSDVNRL